MQRVQNILSVYHKASAGEIDAGLRWYLTAFGEAKRLAVILGFCSDCPSSAVSIAAAIIAAVSPGLRWERNIAAAERIIRGESLAGLGVRWYDGVRKAELIADGSDPESVLKGNKVRAFWQNIADPLGSSAVTLDGHAYAIWSAERIVLDDVPSLSDNQYRRIEDDYIAASEVVGIRPCQLQAMTWITWRRVHGISSAHYLPLFEG